MKLHPLTHPTNPQIGGFICEFPFTPLIEITWNGAEVVTNTLETAKRYAAGLVQHLLENNRQSDLDSLNMPSVVAAIQKLLMDRNERLRAARVKALH